MPVEKASPLPGGEGQGEGSDARDKANGHARIFASPLARRLAAQGGIDLAAVKGSGPHGRIVKHDVDEAQRAGVRKAPEAAAAALPPQNGAQALVPSRAFPAAMADDQILALYEKGSYELRPLDNMRKTIAQRLTQAAATIPHFRLNADCEIDGLLDARERLNARSPKDGPGAYKLSVNDFIIKAMALALQRVPDANATFTERGILIHKASDVGVAVAIDGGLFTPVIRAVEHKTLAQISAEVKELASARAAAAWPRTNIRAAPRPFRTSACSASTASTRSSTRRTPRSWPWGGAKSAPSSRPARSLRRP